jgi:hypothetical protein
MKTPSDRIGHEPEVESFKFAVELLPLNFGAPQLPVVTAHQRQIMYFAEDRRDAAKSAENGRIL